MARNTTKPPRQNRIPPIHLEELAAIWDSDKRMPSAPSRRAWALARRLKPEQVNNWFYRKKGAAKKSGIVISEDTYELPLGIPPALPNAQSLPPSSPIPGTPITKGSDYICVKKEDPYHQEDRATAMLSDDSMFRAYTPAHFSSGSSDAPGSLIGSDDNQYDNGSGGSRFSTRSAGTRTPLTPAEPSFCCSANTPYFVQQRSHINAEMKSLENRAYISYVPSLPSLHSGQPAFVSGMQAKSYIEHAQNFPCNDSSTDRQHQMHTSSRQALPVSSLVTLPHPVSKPLPSPSSTSFSVSQQSRTAQALSLTGPAQPGTSPHGRIQLLQSLNYTYAIERKENRLNESVKQSNPHRYSLCMSSPEPPGHDACIQNLPYSAGSVVPRSLSLSYPSHPTIPGISASFPPPPQPIAERAESPIQELQRLYLPAEDAEEQKQEKRSTRIILDRDTYSCCLGGKRYSYDGFFLGICECSGSVTADSKDARDVQMKYKRYDGCTGPW